ncbi:class I SAM-dependent methyltransferase [Dasania marina]|mgnify:CR=1 FL=1|uniref:class I SAM-dependent methyltransferase n=1 Tax=Dasania marina TaxID=471499 RepID=UPI0030DC9375|tara:strand:+ start:56249 stop:57004 length:756 start_codon:yes stop_codon:yes gene_type:complete
MLFPNRINSYFVNVLAFMGYKVIRITKEDKLKKIDASLIDPRSIKTYGSLPYAGDALEYMVENFDFETVLDIGSGEGLHGYLLRGMGKSVTSIDYGESLYFKKKEKHYDCITADYGSYKFDCPFDAIWASHVLEHQLNPNIFLKKIHSDLKEGGVLAITVPPLKHEIVGGHVTLWNAGLLLYQLVLAGFNCREASIKSYGYNISVVIKKESIKSYPEISYDSGDIDKLSEFFPKGFSEPFDGDIKLLNWAT